MKNELNATDNKIVNLKTVEPVVTIAVVKYELIKVANFLIENTHLEIEGLKNIAGCHCSIGWYSISLVKADTFPVDDMKEELDFLNNAYRYYKNVREAAKKIANDIAMSMIPEKTWTREGNKFVRIK